MPSPFAGANLMLQSTAEASTEVSDVRFQECRVLGFDGFLVVVCVVPCSLPRESWSSADAEEIGVSVANTAALRHNSVFLTLAFYLKFSQGFFVLTIFRSETN